MPVNMNYKQFRATMTDQRQRLRTMLGQVDDELYDEIRDTYLPQLVEDVQNAVPILTGHLAEEGITYTLKHTKKKTVSLTVSAKAYHNGYNYAYIQHENEDYSHEHGTHHYISGPFEKMIRDIADIEGLNYAEPADDESVFGSTGTAEGWEGDIETG